MKKTGSFLWIVFCLMSVNTFVKAQSIALRTNMAEWALMTPNIGVDLVLNEFSTVDVNVFVTAGYSYFKHTQIVGGQVEYRYWFSHQPYEHFFLGLQATPLHYKMNVKHGIDLTRESDNAIEHIQTKTLHDGIALPVGLNFGYSWPLSKKLSLEVCYGAGWIYYNNSCMVENENRLAGYIYEEHNSHNMTFSTTNFGVNVTYILK